MTTGTGPMAAALAVALAAAVAWPGPAVGAESTDPDRIVYVNGRFRGYPTGAIHTVRADGAVDTQVTSGHLDSAPVWSPDGSRLAFDRSYPDDRQEVWVANADGTDAQRLAEDGFGPIWSPDGTRVAYSTAHSVDIGQYDGSVQIIDSDGTDQRSVPGTDGGFLSSWSPDGASLVLLYYGVEGGGSAYRRNIDGSGSSQLDGGELVVGDVVWSPDSTRLAYATLAPFDEHQGIYTVRADGGDRQRIASGFRGTAASPAWSPDGRQLAFSAADSFDGPRHVRVVNADGTNLRVLTGADGSDQGPEWSADGRQLTFTRVSVSGDDVDDDVWVINADGSAEHRVTATEISTSAGFAPGLVQRLGGASRIETAVMLSRSGFPTAAAAILARADDYADALAGAPLGASVGGPVLLTGRDGLPSAVSAELTRLAVSTVYLLGGDAALAPSIEADLRELGVVNIVRFDGATRFHTAGLIGTELEAVDHAYVVEGANTDRLRGWPDAVSVSALAAFERRPILLVSRDELPAATAQAIVELGLEGVTIVGGPTAVSNDVEADLAALDVEVERVAGATRYETSRLLAGSAVEAGMDPRRTWFATGRTYADALAAGPGAAADGGVLLLVDGQALDGSPAAEGWLTDHRGAFEDIHLVGGSAAITPIAQIEVEQAAGLAP